MNSLPEKRAKPTSSDAEEGEIVDKPNSSPVKRNLKSITLVKEEEGKDNEKPKSSLVKRTLSKASSMKNIDNPKIMKKKDQLSSKTTANPVDRVSEDFSMNKSECAKDLYQL